MTQSAIVDVVVGIALVYLSVALLCTAIQEWAAQLLNLRARHQKASIRILLGGSATGNADAEAVLRNPLVRMLAAGQGVSPGPRDPSYVPARNFADALLELLVPLAQRPIDLVKVRAGINTLISPAPQQPLAAIVARAAAAAPAGQELASVVDAIEHWCDAAMDHASGWYKRKVKWFLLAIGLFVSVAVNADSIQVGARLAADAALRAKVVALAGQTAPPGANPEETLKKLHDKVARVDSTGNVVGLFGDLPIGWSVCRDDKNELAPARCYGDISVEAYAALPLKVAGLLLTALAAALGAPFWFGLLQQLNAIRSAGPKPTSLTATGTNR